MREGEIKIIQALNDVPKGFNELKKLTGLSSPSLSENLKRLVSNSLILKNEVSKKYSLPEICKPFKIQRGSLKKNLRLNYADVGYWSSTIQIMEKMNIDFNKKDLVEEYVTMVLSSLWDNLLSIIYISLQENNPNLIKENVDNYLLPIIIQIAEEIEPTFVQKNHEISQTYLRYMVEINDTSNNYRKKFLEKMKPYITELNGTETMF